MPFLGGPNFFDWDVEIGLYLILGNYLKKILFK